MDLSKIDFPPQPGTEEWLEELKSTEEVDIAVPLAVEEDEISWVMGVILVSADEVVFCYHGISSWNLFKRYPLESEFHVYQEDLLKPEVGFVSDDAREVNRLSTEFAEKVLDVTGLAFSPYVNPVSGDRMIEAREQCDCKSISEDRVRPVEGLSGIESDRFFMCADCSQIHGLEYRRSPVPKSKAFDPDWILESRIPEEVIDIKGESDYLLYTSGDTIGKLEHTIGLMNAIGGGISSTFSAYVPSEQDAIVYVCGEEVSGYLTWKRMTNGKLALQQLFVRRDYRKRGIASHMIRKWESQYCDQDTFYVEEPNEKSITLLEKLGYFEPEPKAVEHFLAIGLVNNWEEGKERAEVVQ